MSRWFLGVDGGQSSTIAMIADETGRVAGFARGGACNHVSADEARTKFLSAVGGCVKKACEQAGIEPDFEAACLGFSGGPADKESLVREFLQARQLLITHDGLIALAGACSGAPGVIVIAGTGSFAFGRGADGTSVRAGGWGFAFGDEGGGFDITRQALRAALRFEEGWGLRTALHARLLEATGAHDANQLLHDFYKPEYPRSRIAALARLVDQCAQEGDPTAVQILHHSASELATLAAVLLRRLFRPGEPARVCYIGGVFQSAQLRERFRMLVELDTAVTVSPPDHGPAAGALIEAMRLAGLPAALTNLPEVEK